MTRPVRRVMRGVPEGVEDGQWNVLRTMSPTPIARVYFRPG